jgi:type I restriction enzyme R subunit
MPAIITESEVEENCLDLLRNLGYVVVYGPDVSEGGVAEERKYGEVVLVGRLRDALKRINKSILTDRLMRQSRRFFGQKAKIK